MATSPLLSLPIVCRYVPSCTRCIYTCHLTSRTPLPLYVPDTSRTALLLTEVLSELSSVINSARGVRVAWDGSVTAAALKSHDGNMHSAAVSVKFRPWAWDATPELAMLRAACGEIGSLPILSSANANSAKAAEREAVNGAIAAYTGLQRELLSRARDLGARVPVERSVTQSSSRKGNQEYVQHTALCPQVFS